MIEEKGPVRIDLLGGTLDLEPINLILEKTVTLNLATSLQAEVKIEKGESGFVTISSLDYDSVVTYRSQDFNGENLSSDFFGPLSFVARILSFFECTDAVKVTLKSGSPAGAGLGGSSAMGVTLYKALARYLRKPFDKDKCIEHVKRIESCELACGPTGYQDYYPALYGGVLALLPSVEGVKVEQLYHKQLEQLMTEQMTLVFSGQTRLSGINNWAVYKSFFDETNNVKEGLGRIADLSHQALVALRAGEFQKLFPLIKEEGSVREQLFPNIVTPEMTHLLQEVQKVDASAGMKVCGAGGGGCFILIHEPGVKQNVKELIQNNGMKELNFSIIQQDDLL